MDELILGIWDGHDSGAAIVQRNKVLCAVNEERLTRRKLEISFPAHAIMTCLSYARILPGQIKHVAVSTTDTAKTLARIFPSTKENYYLIRRKKKEPGVFTSLKKRMKYKVTEFKGNAITQFLSRQCIRNELEKLAFNDCSIHFEDHHLCHTTTAAFCSGYSKALVVTIDGIGDALSGTVNIFNEKKLERIHVLPGKHSLGIFFEHITNLMNMRELEDEGKVMALANYAFPIPDDENPILSFIKVDGLNIICRYESLRLYDALKKIFWQYPSEQFAYMAQRTIEVKVCEFLKNCIKKTNIKNIVLAGGVFSNIKLNMLLRLLPQVNSCFVFPHMGDGGLALGAAFSLNFRLNNITVYDIPNVYWGPAYTDAEILTALQAAGYKADYYSNIETITAKIICDGNIVFWFQGRMEYGPRALGNRSILALPSSTKIRDILNLRLKMRVWYQPFCPSMLEEEADIYLENYRGTPNRYMTMGYMVKEKKRKDFEGVIGLDGSCRPQMVTAGEGRY